MGLFDFLKKKKKNDKLTESSLEVAPATGTSLSVRGSTVHNDLRDLVWIGDGKYKNYKQATSNKNTMEINGIRISISFMNQEEPSLIYTNQKVTQLKNINEVERPPYYPTYSGLTPEQKWVYLKLLSNPYDSSIDIGFVFILYYGLERHLLSENFEEAIDVILKLRDVHTNKSFQVYSANAIVLSCMLHQRGDLVLKFIESLDKEHELAFSDNLFLICYFSFDLPLLPQDIMRMAKTFEFNNMNYIKKYPGLFIESLTEAIKSKVGMESVDLKKYLTSSEIKKVKKQDVSIFANMSINDKSIPIPLLSDNFKLKREMYNFLETAHENVKKNPTEMRKTGKAVPVKKTLVKPKKEIVFDVKQGKALLTGLSKNKKNLVDRHFSYISLQDFYYKYRTVNDKYIEKCIEYCNLDINSLSEMQEAYISEEIKRAQQLASFSDSKNLKEEIEEIKKRGFIGNIPAFKRLAIIYEKQEKYDEAISICDRAITYGQSVQDFEERKQKLQRKKGSDTGICTS